MKYILPLVIALVFSACNDSSKKTEEAVVAPVETNMSVAPVEENTSVVPVEAETK